MDLIEFSDWQRVADANEYNDNLNGIFENAFAMNVVSKQDAQERQKVRSEISKKFNVALGVNMIITPDRAALEHSKKIRQGGLVG